MYYCRNRHFWSLVCMINRYSSGANSIRIELMSSQALSCSTTELGWQWPERKAYDAQGNATFRFDTQQSYGYLECPATGLAVFISERNFFPARLVPSIRLLAEIDLGIARVDEFSASLRHLKSLVGWRNQALVDPPLITC